MKLNKFEMMKLKQMMTKTWMKMSLTLVKVLISVKEKVEEINVMSTLSKTLVSIY